MRIRTNDFKKIGWNILIIYIEEELLGHFKGNNFVQRFLTVANFVEGILQIGQQIKGGRIDNNTRELHNNRNISIIVLSNQCCVIIHEWDGELELEGTIY